MGKRKIQVKKIDDDRIRLATFQKRKLGVIKKAMELSLLCDVEVALVVFGQPTMTNKTGKLCQYSSKDIDILLTKFVELAPAEVYTNEDYEEKFTSKSEKELGDDGDEEHMPQGHNRTDNSASREELQQAVRHLQGMQGGVPQRPPFPNSDGLAGIAEAAAYQQQYLDASRSGGGGGGKGKNSGKGGGKGVKSEGAAQGGASGGPAGGKAKDSSSNKKRRGPGPPSLEISNPNSAPTMGGGQYAGGGGAPEETPFFSSLTDSAPPLPSPGSALTGLNMGKTGWNQFPLASPGSAPIPSPATLLNVGGAPFSARDFAAATPSAATGGLQTPTSWADGGKGQRNPGSRR